MKRKIIHVSDSENEDRLEPILYMGYGSDADSADNETDEDEPLSAKIKRYKTLKAGNYFNAFKNIFLQLTSMTL